MLHIKWNKRALLQLDKAIRYIEKDSFTNAERVEKSILRKIQLVAKNPESCSPDKYKMNNNGSFRAFELHHYRVAYKITANEIIIVRIRHTAQSPLKY